MNVPLQVGLPSVPSSDDRISRERRWLDFARTVSTWPAPVTARKFRPDLILLDVMMPDMDGGDVAARLRADPLLRDTPVIFLTAIVSNGETDGHEMVSGAETFLAKPVDIGELRKTLEQRIRS